MAESCCLWPQRANRGLEETLSAAASGVSALSWPHSLTTAWEGVLPAPSQMRKWEHGPVSTLITTV